MRLHCGGEADTVRRTLIPMIKKLVLGMVACVGLAWGFEGRVDFKTTEGKQAQVMQYYVRGDWVRLDLPKTEEAAAMLIDVKKQDMYMLMSMEGQKMYMKHSFKDVGAGEDEGEKGPEPVETGRKEDIVGYSCSEYTVKEKNGQITELWLAKGLGYFFLGAGEGMGKGGSGSPGWEKIVREREFFPLRVVTRSKSGKELHRMEAVAIETKTPAKELFSLDGYTPFSLPGM